MKFAELINNNNWPTIGIEFLKLYPLEKVLIGEYKRVFNDLKSLNPLPTKMTIILSNEINEFDNIEFVDVLAYYKGKKGYNGKDLDFYHIEYVRWEEWLDAVIDKKTLEDFSITEIICHCLHGMAFCGFNQEDIQIEKKEVWDSAIGNDNIIIVGGEQEDTISEADLMKNFNVDLIGFS